ncbi:hypothetical protein SAMN04487947_0260 [Halogeometricum rufum]|uniref:Uncharacterized protein n=1 Tax=Halogeometricum rufum TaxID=553469 RepID=A0A1I6FYP7_9EURY|nr:hypothetical protein [Halogeometricum rufum]SFR35065.1 hypothetical protein SAMN04487947_0260 [Halogeometricum rufum]
MVVGSGQSRLLFLGGIGGLAVTDLLFRGVAELVGIGDSLVVPLGMLIVSRHVLDLATIGWGIGWLFLFSLVFYFAPHLFPTRISDWAAGLPVRTALSVSAILVGIVTEKAIVSLIPSVGTTPFPLSVQSAVVVVGMTVPLFGVATVLPNVGSSTRVLSYDDESMVVLPKRMRTELSFFEFTFRGAFVAVALGVLLAEVSLLYPIPELLVVGFAAYDSVGGSIGTPSYLPAGRDLAEKISTGTVAAWGGIRELLVLLYVTFVIFVAVVFGLYVFSQWSLPQSVIDSPENVGLGLILVVPSIVYAVQYGVRILERIPGQMRTSMHGVETPDEIRTRAPGFLLPPVCLVLLASLTEQTAAIPLGETAFWAVAVVAAASTLLFAFGTFPVAVELSDFHALPWAVGVSTLATGVGFAAVNGPLTGGPNEVETVGVAAVVAFVLMSPYVVVTGFSAWRDDPQYGTDGGMRRLAISWGAFTVCFLVSVGVFIAVGSPESLPEPVGGVLGIALLVSAFAVAVNTALVLYDLAKAAARLLLVVGTAIVFTPVWLLSQVGEWIAKRSVLDELRK